MVFTNKVDGICFTDNTTQETAFSLLDKRKLAPILEISTPNVLVIRDRLIITDGIDSEKSAIFGPDGLRTTNPDGLQVDSKINMKTNDIDNVDNLEVNTINDIPFNSFIQNLESVLTTGDDAAGKDIKKLGILTFYKDSSNKIYEKDITNNLIIQSPNDIDLSGNKINSNCDIDMSNNDINLIKSLTFYKDSSNKIYEKDITKNLIIQSPYDIDLSSNRINCNCDIDMLNHDISNIKSLTFYGYPISISSDLSSINTSINELYNNANLNILNEGSILFSTHPLGVGNLLWNNYSIGMNWTKIWQDRFLYESNSGFTPVSEISINFPEKFLNSYYYITFTCNFFSEGSRPSDPELALYFSIIDDGDILFSGTCYNDNNPWCCHFNRSQYNENPMSISYADIYNLEGAKNNLRIHLYYHGSITQNQNFNILINFQKTNSLDPPSGLLIPLVP